MTLILTISPTKKKAKNFNNDVKKLLVDVVDSPVILGVIIPKEYITS
jgi:hypothetical protein